MSQLKCWGVGKGKIRVHWTWYQNRRHAPLPTTKFNKVSGWTRAIYRSVSDSSSLKTHNRTPLKGLQRKHLMFKFRYRRWLASRRRLKPRYFVVADLSPFRGGYYFAPVRGLSEGRRICRRWVELHVCGKASILKAEYFRDEWKNGHNQPFPYVPIITTRGFRPITPRDAQYVTSRMRREFSPNI